MGISVRRWSEVFRVILSPEFWILSYPDPNGVRQEALRFGRALFLVATQETDDKDDSYEYDKTYNFFIYWTNKTLSYVV